MLVKVKNLQTAGFILTVLAGSLLHFVYEWSGKSKIIAPFSAVNESVWEHLKLLFVPMLLFGAAEYFIYGKNQKNFIPVRLLSILLGMGLIVTAFYTYSGIIGKNFLAADILIFVAAVYAAYRYSGKMLGTQKLSSHLAIGLAVLGTVLLIVCAFAFTFSPPHIALFRDPVSGAFGIRGAG